MITNERQYKITRNKALSLSRAIEEFDPASRESLKIHPRLVRAEKEGMESLLATLNSQINEYETLKSSTVATITASRFEELALGLIKARIARGLSQRQLATQLGVKEQQIQRYEADQYRSASYQRLCDVAQALEVQIRNEIQLPLDDGSFKKMLAKVKQVGISREFILSRLMSLVDAERIRENVAKNSDSSRIGWHVALALERVFGWHIDDLIGDNPITAQFDVAGAARFKVPRRRSERDAQIFAAYARYIAGLAIKGLKETTRKHISSDPMQIRRRLLDYESDDFQSTLELVWDLGVVVVPLRGKGTFHGACWRIDGKNVIVLKQSSNHESRWKFDLLHELYHAAQRSHEENFEVIEADITSDARRESEEEAAANKFAGNVLLKGKADILAQECINSAGDSMGRLKGVVRRVANQHDVDVGALANYVAYQFSFQGRNWWGTAANLQQNDGDPWSIARDVFINRHGLRIDNEIDRVLLGRALKLGKF